MSQPRKSVGTVAHRWEEIRILATPADLRALADRMEAFWAERILGSSTVTHSWDGEGFVVLLIIDQDRMAE